MLVFRRRSVHVVGGLCIAALVLLAVQQARATEIFVAPGGNDTNPGTREAPVATLTRARDLARQQKPAKEPQTIRLRGGTYYLDQPLVLEVIDSGTAEAPVTWTAFEGETAIVSGGRRLALKWSAYKDGILQAEVPGVKEGKIDFDQLFLDGRRQHMARYPNYNPAARNYGGTAADAIGPQRAKRWSRPTDGFLHALHRAEWGDLHYRITGVDAAGKVKLEGGWQNNRQMGFHGQHRMVENLFEELDAPGEWYLNHTKGVLYFMPPTGIDLAAARIEAAGLKRLIDIRGSQEKPVRHIAFRELTFTHAARTFMEPYEPLLRSDWRIYRGGAVTLEGTEDCAVADCFFDAVGGNAIFVSNYNRRAAVTGCKITEAGASAVCFVGDPKAVRFSADEYGRGIPLDKLDTTPGPKTDNYPADCRVHDCLLARFGVFEKQTAGVQIAMSESITVSHSSIYDCPRAGINIGDGCWGGHVLEFNDVFDTVKETGDHGSFNSWGRDRFWNMPRAVLAKYPDMPKWDCRKTIVIRNNRFRCDHGWDIDLDDGSSNYLIENNLLLNGGLKFREGFFRTGQNNVIVNNSFHPHVWYPDSGDVFSRNIVGTWYHPIGMPPVWGKTVDYNLLPDAAALARSRGMKMDLHSTAGDPQFIDPAGGDYRVKEGSPALALGFVNFAMDRFGVLKPALRAEARTPQLPGAKAGKPAAQADERLVSWLGAKVKGVTTLGEVSAAGLPGQVGVMLMEVPQGSAAAKAGLRRIDVVLECDGKAVNKAEELVRLHQASPKEKVPLTIFRAQRQEKIEVPKN